MRRLSKARVSLIRTVTTRPIDKMNRYQFSIPVAVMSVLLLTPALRAQSPEAHKEIVVQMIEAVNDRDFGLLDDLVSADVVRHSTATPGVVVSNLEQFKSFLHQDLAAVPDAQQQIHLILAQNDLVAVRAIYRGTQTGQMGPFPPSGKIVELPFMAILRVEDGMIAEMWVEWDNLSALSQLGHFPPGTGGTPDVN